MQCYFNNKGERARCEAGKSLMTAKLITARCQMSTFLDVPSYYLMLFLTPVLNHSKLLPLYTSCFIYSNIGSRITLSLRGVWVKFYVLVSYVSNIYIGGLLAMHGQGLSFVITSIAQPAN